MKNGKLVGTVGIDDVSEDDLLGTFLENRQKKVKVSRFGGLL